MPTPSLLERLRAADWSRAPHLAGAPPVVASAALAGHTLCHLTAATAPEATVPALLPLLAVDERERARGMSPARRSEFVSLRALLRLALSALVRASPAALSIAIDPAGKPHLAAWPGAAGGGVERGLRGPWFSLSHASGTGLVALCESAPVGVDLEDAGRRTRIDPRAVAGRTFGPGDRARVLACPDAERPGVFLRLWVRREAAVKATGVGMARAFGAFDVGAAERHPVLVPSAADQPPQPVAILDLPSPRPDLLAAAALVVGGSAILGAPP